MAKLLNIWMILMSLGLTIPSSIFAAEEMNSTLMAEEGAEKFDLKSLEEELRRLLEDNPEDLDFSNPESKQSIESEKDTLILHPSRNEDEMKELKIEYTEPMTDAFKKELKAQPKGTEEEIVILDEEDDLDDNNFNF